MKKLGLFAVLAVLVASLGQASADGLKSGLQPGDSLGPYTVEKVAGNPNDNVAVGKNLCYRCMLGNKPVVMIFTRKPDKSLASLVKQLDSTLPKHSDKKLSSFVNVIGDKDANAVKETAKKFGEEVASENVAIVVPENSENGPDSYKLNPEAEVTVILYRNGTVAASHAFAPGKLSAEGVSAIIADTAKIVN